ncbi:MAG: hypothetical protein E6J90_12800 [Deltaproteobacteria bacterium]|nr:MAG: hypothetical protein E6J91_52685 [Deltaproteobacteria bacterium]TMQ22251.1 MAG: hypothetical protein E6J90_12800 [Deltaproteobacteria bacterium]
MLVMKLMGIAMVLVCVVRRRRMGASALVLLAVMALQLLGCVTDAPVQRDDHANVQPRGSDSDEPGTSGDPDSESGELDSGSATPAIEGCPDPKNCGDPSTPAGGFN